MLLLLALLFTLGAHLRPACDFTVGGELIESGCSPAAAKQAREAALMAAEEILPGPAELPESQRHIRLTLGKRAGSSPALCHALLESCPGVMAGEAVYAQGQRLGRVRDGAALCAALNRYIENTLPTWASTGRLGTDFTLRPMYTRAAWEVSNEDMVMLLTGLAPVMYSDGKGRVSPV